MDPLGQQVTAGVLGVDEVEIGHMVHQASVGLFRHVLVEAAVAGLQVVDGYAHPLGHHRRDAAVGVTQHDNGIRPFFEQHLLGPDQGLPKNSTQGRGVDAQPMIRLADTQVRKEHLVEQVVVVLAGVNQHVVHSVVEAGDHPRQADQLRPRTHNRHHFEHGYPSTAVQVIARHRKSPRPSKVRQARRTCPRHPG